MPMGFRKLRWPTKIQFYDKLSRSVNFVLVTWAAVGAVSLVVTYTHFFIYGRPLIEKRNRELRQKQLELEQAEIEAVLLEEQKKAEAMGYK